MSCLLPLQKYHKLYGLNNRNLFFTVLETENLKIKVPDDLVSDKSFFLACRQLLLIVFSHVRRPN